ncbi:MAG: hydrogenase iron-sulfur subunit [Promethearchaeota archaeon]
MSSKQKSSYKPRILAFICNWTGFSAEDLAKSGKFNGTSSIKVVRVTCSGSVSPALILDAFNAGNDGVIICGCESSKCHYITGNVKAEERVEKAIKILKFLGIPPERVKLERISPSEKEKFVDIFNEFSNNLLSLGPIKSSS